MVASGVKTAPASDGPNFTIFMPSILRVNASASTTLLMESGSPSSAMVADSE